MVCSSRNRDYRTTAYAVCVLGMAALVFAPSFFAARKYPGPVEKLRPSLRTNLHTPQASRRIAQQEASPFESERNLRNNREALDPTPLKWGPY